MRPARRVLSLAAGLIALSSFASGYYHWVFFANHDGPYSPVRAKFDLNALPNNTVSYFISDQSPGPLMPDDSFAAVVSQIRLAAAVWDGVASSALRLKFGGIATIGTPQSAPGIDVVFDDNMPPGLLAQTRPTLPDDLSSVANGAAFVPIVRSRIQFRRDLTANQQASYYDAFFLTMVHEFGHSLGLQHTMTSGVMSTAITRATTKATPLSADDVAGVSLLYPAEGFLAGTGSITGTVLLASSGVNLASVVALSTSGVAISGMTNPDGSYRIDGIPPGQYYVYAHPLPPPQQGEAYPANIYPPQDAAKNSFPANTGFDTQFFPGTRDWAQAELVGVTAGASANGTNFYLQGRAGPAVYNMTTYGFLGAGGQVPVQAPPFVSGTRAWLVFYANGIIANNNQLAAGLNVSVIGGAAQVEPTTVQYDAGSGGYAMIVVDANSVSATTPTALAVTTNNDLYVLPSAFTVVPSAPPSISSVNPSGSDAQGNPLAAISGTNLGPNTRILFDGASANILNANPDGSLLVSAPPASGNHRAAVEALNNDSQTSSQALGSAAPPWFTYAAADNPTISVNPSSIPAGTDSMIVITGFNTNFVDGQTVVGFGSSDILARRVWVLSPGRLLLNVSANASAQPAITSVSVASGLQLATLNAAFQIASANPAQMSLRVPILNQATGLPGAPAGGRIIINTSGLPQNLGGWRLTISDQNANFQFSSGQIIAQVPSGLSIGPAVVRLISPNGDNIPSVLMQVDAPPPVIAAAMNASGAAIDAAHPAHPGDLVTLTVAGLFDASATVPSSSVNVNVAGVDQGAVSVIAVPAQPGVCLVQFVLSSNVPSGQQQAQSVTVGISTRISAAFPIAVAAI